MAILTVLPKTCGMDDPDGAGRRLHALYRRRTQDDADESRLADLTSRADPRRNSRRISSVIMPIVADRPNSVGL
ncbi:MAG: hypothetical protein U0703_01770 [Anaerolineae bacterium]